VTLASVNMRPRFHPRAARSAGDATGDRKPEVLRHCPLGLRTYPSFDHSWCTALTSPQSTIVFDSVVYSTQVLTAI